MAVLRSNRLWLNTFPPGARVGTLPTPEHPPKFPEVRTEWTLYTCPLGKRAIVRHASFIIHGSGGATYTPTFSVALGDTPSVPTWHPIVMWGWYRDLTDVSGTVWTYAYYWSGHLVMHGGEKLYLTHNSITSLSTQGSGALMDVPT